MGTTRIITVICWIVSALVLIGLLIWFLTGSVFGIGGENMNWFRNISIRGIGNFENLSGPFESQGTHSEDASNINTINISWVSGEITVTPHDGNEIRVTEFAQRELRDNEKLRMDKSGGTLTVSFRESGTFRGNMPRKNLEVLVPRSLSENMTNLSVNTTSGNINVNDFNASTLKLGSVSASINATNITSQTAGINTTSGTITLNNIKTDKLDTSSVSGALNATEITTQTIEASTTSGSTNISGEFERAEVSSVSGITIIKSTIAPSSLNISSVSGNIEVHIPNTENLTANHSAVSGRFSSEIPMAMQGNGAYRFSSVSGNTNIYELK